MQALAREMRDLEDLDKREERTSWLILVFS